MRWLLATAIVLVCSVDARAQCYWDVRYNTCPRPPSVTGNYGTYPLDERRRVTSQELMSDTKLLDYWIKRSRNPR
jgi:hypothetical protein